MQARRRRIFVHTMPLFHTTGCAICVLGIIDAGATMLLAPLFDPALIVKVIERERPSFLLGVPTMLVALCNETAGSGRDVSSLKRILSGGAMVAPELVSRVRAVFGPTVQIAYGQTESSPVITMARHDDAMADLTGTIGQPLPNMDVAILDPQTAGLCRSASRGRSATAALCRVGLTTIRRRRRRRSTPTAGCTPATSAGWTRAATSRSPGG